MNVADQTYQVSQPNTAIEAIIEARPAHLGTTWQGCVRVAGLALRGISTSDSLGASQS